MSEPQEPPPDQPRPEPVQEDAFTILDLILILVRRRRIIAITTGAAAAVLLAYNLAAMALPPESPLNLLPDRYTASVIVMITEDAPEYGSGAASVLSQIPAGGGGLADFAGLLAAEGSTDANRAQELLFGRSILDALAVQQGLVTDASGNDEILAARRWLRDNLSTDYRIDSGLLEISFDHIYPELAASGLQFAVDRLGDKVRDLSIERVRLRKDFLKERMDAVERDRKAAQEKLIAFQTREGVIDPAAQSESTIQRLTALKTDLYRKEVEIQSQIEMLGALGADNAGVQRLRIEADTLRTLIEEIERGPFEDDHDEEAQPTFQASDPPLNDLPELSVQYLDLATEVGVHDTIHSFLRSQYESVRIEESAREASFQIVEEVETPRRKSRPRRSLICIIGTLAACMASVLAAFTLEYFRRAAVDPAQRRQLDAIRDEIGLKR